MARADRLLLEELRRTLPPERLLEDPLERRLYQRDASFVVADPLAVALVDDAAEAARVVALCHRHEVPFTARGAGTSLTGSATPLERSLIVSTSRMSRIRSLDPARQVAWVEPGVVNLDVTAAAAPHGLHYAPDPSSQASCTIGGNIATNAGGAHTLLHGVTTSHVLALDLVLPDGRTTRLGSLAGETFGPDLRALVVGAEGTMGLVTGAAVRLTPSPAAHRTLLLAFPSATAAGATVSAIVAEGVRPAALELMDRKVVTAVEAVLAAGLPTDAAAVLLVEVEGEVETVERAATEVVGIADAWVSRRPEVARDEAQRALWWQARKGAFAALARIEPNYYLHDTVIPRSRLADVLDEVAAIAERERLTIVNVFHAGDGNLHPVIAYDRRRPGEFDRVLSAGHAIIATSLAVGGVLTGEHGIGVEKRAFMARQFDEPSLDLQRRLRYALDPAGRSNPGKVIPAPAGCADAA